MVATKAFALCCTLDAALPYRDELAFFQAIKSALTKSAHTDKKLQDEAKEYALRQIISKSVIATDVVDIFAAAGLHKPNIDLLSDEFLEEIRHMKERNLAVELLERLITKGIQAKFKTNVVQQQKFSKLLQEALIRYSNRAVETSQVIEELIAMAKQFKEEAKRGEALGLTPDEMAFYDALGSNEASVREMGDEILKKIAQELTAQLRKNISIDWSVRTTLQAKLRIMVKNILRRYKYPADKQDQAVATVLQQAEMLSEEWVVFDREYTN